jgi:hypothetical protein
MKMVPAEVLLSAWRRLGKWRRREASESGRRGGGRRRRLAAVRSADRFSGTLLLRPNFRGFVQEATCRFKASAFAPDLVVNSVTQRCNESGKRSGL